MHQVNCTHCGRIVQISPDAPRCSVCGQDLHTLIPEGYTAPYFYHRAADLAARGDLPSALAEAERGLAYIESTELRLLAAILAKRLDDMDAVRAHVAAIPVDDRLRQEAEWLLRSQTNPRPASVIPVVDPEPERPVATRHERGRSRAHTQSPSPLEGTTISVAAAVGDAAPATPAAQGAAKEKPGSSTLWAQRLWGTVALVLVLIAGAMGWTLLSGGPDALLALLPGLSDATPAPVVQGPQLEPVTPMPLILPTPTPQGAAPAVQAAPGDLPEPAEQAAPTVPPDFVRAPTPQPVAGSGLAAAAGLAPATLDLPALLINAGRSDLAAANVRAAIDGAGVRVSGILTSTADRQEIVDLLEGIEALDQVNAVDLLVRIPATYTVQAGDSLWSIVGKFYGVDSNRMTQLIELNSATFGENPSLQVGDVLQLPPLN
jgi:nucleoid-associated protein YgaU